jgi:cell division protein ZapA (FtsZ GTPase activity inhibitor)
MSQRVPVTIRRIGLDNVSFEGIEPMEIASLAADIEKKMEQIALERKTADTIKLALYVTLEYAAAAYLKNMTSDVKSKEASQQLDEAIIKLRGCLEKTPSKII